jgi:hypothetical protein
MNFLTIDTAAIECHTTAITVDTPRTKKRKAQALPFKSNRGLKSSNYALRSKGSNDENNPKSLPPSTDSPFRWAKRQAKKNATKSNNETKQLSKPVAPSVFASNPLSSLSPTINAPRTTTIEFDAAGDKRATAEDAVTVLDRQALQPFNDPTTECISMCENFQSNEWSKVYYAVESFRRLCIHHSSEIFNDSLDSKLTEICKSAKDLRSAVARNSLKALADVFFCRENDSNINQVNAMTFCSEESLNLVVSTLLEQSASDKKFLRMEAEKALQQLTLLSELDGKIFLAIAQHVNHKRTKIPGLVGKYGLRSLKSSSSLISSSQSSVSSLSSSSSSEKSKSLFSKFTLDTMLQTFSILLTAKDHNGRLGGKQGFEHLFKLLGKDVFLKNLKCCLPLHEVKDAAKAAGIKPKKVKRSGTSLKEQIRLAKAKMKDMKVQSN